MQSRVFGRMESWRGGVRRVEGGVKGGLKVAREWFTAAWRSDTSPAGPGVDHAESGSRPVMRDDGAAEKERIASGAGAREQIARGAAVHEVSRVSEPDRQ